MNIVNYAINALTVKARAFEKSTKDPLKIQKKILFDYLNRNCKTEYGLRYDFSRIKSIEGYQRLVPMNDYEGFRSYIDKMTKGENNILTLDKPLLFSTTSGTTGKPKFIPISQYARNKKASVMSLWMYYMFRDHPDITGGKILVIVSPEVEGHVESGLPYGAETGHGYKSLPLIIKRICSLPYEVFEIKDYNAKYYCMLRIVVGQDVRAVATMNPSTIVLLCEKIDELKERIIEDIEKGTLDKSLDIDPGIRRVVERYLRPDPKRAAELRMILAEKKELLPRDFWPNMKLIICWKGGTVGLYLKEFPSYFGEVPIRDFGYLSSEARASIPISNEGAGGILAIGTNFYEFIPKEDVERKEKRVLLCDQLEKDKEYFIIMTTPGGLYRYKIGDLIRVAGFFNKTPIIEFVQRGLNVTSVTGEKLYESQVVKAVNKAIDKHEVFLEFFTACLQQGKPFRYIFLVEFTEKQTLDKKKGLLKSIEEGLGRINVEYKAKRSSQRLGSPILKVVREGGFEKYRARRIEEGTHDSQFKIPELTADLNFQKNFNIEEEISLD